MNIIIEGKRLLIDGKFRELIVLNIKGFFLINRNSKYINFKDYKFFQVNFKSSVSQIEEILVNEVYRFRNIKNDGVIIDCGANIGISSIFFAREYPGLKVYSFEADPLLAKVLSNNVNSNNVNNVKVISKAVWVRDGKLRFNQDKSDGGSIISNGNIEVEAIRLKSFIQKQSKIKMLKIDIEGAEVDVIKDCEQELWRVQNLFIEYHSVKSKKQELGELLKILGRNGFRYKLNSINSSNLSPFICNHNNERFDLQVNIFAINEKII